MIQPLGIARSLATAANDFIVASGVGVFVKKTLAEVKTLLGLSGTVGGNVPASTAGSDFVVGDSTTGNWIKKTLAETKAILDSPWVDVPYAAGNFSASGAMTWTVEAADVVTYRYKMLSDDMMLLQWKITTSSIGGTLSTELHLSVPNGKTIVGATKAFSFNELPSFSLGVIGMSSGFTYVLLYSNTAYGNWPASTNETYINGEAILRVS